MLQAAEPLGLKPRSREREIAALKRYAIVAAASGTRDGLLRAMPGTEGGASAERPRATGPERFADQLPARRGGYGGAAMTAPCGWLMAEGRSPDGGTWLGESAMDMWPYRDRTVALLRRYARASVGVGRLPLLLGRECFRAKVRSYPMSSFEDVVIFVHDMDNVLRKLNPFQQRLIAMNVLEEYSLREVARLLPCPLRTVEREVPDALDVVSRALLESGLIKQARKSRCLRLGGLRVG